MALKNDQYNMIMRRYDLNRQQALNKARELEIRLQKEIPAYKAIEDQMITLAANHARLLIQGHSASDIHQQVEALEAQKREVLIASGLSPELTKPVFTCPDCQDTGYIGEQKCHCFKQAIVDMVYTQSNIREQLETENFDTFNLEWYSDEVDPRFGISPKEHMRTILNSCLSFIKNFDTQTDNILFYGNTGVGKTFLSHCIAKELLDTAHTVIYLTAQDLMETLTAHALNKESEPDMPEDMISYIRDCDLLIIDDLGTELANSLTVSQLFSCLDDRLQNQRSTIISTNLSLDDLQDTYSERIFSRLISYYQVSLILGDDIRIQKAIS